MCVNRMDIRRAELIEILPLREAVIIVGTGRSSCFDKDHAPETYHYGIFDDICCLACATLIYSEWEGASAYQLRGMATSPESRGKGLGRLLLQKIQTDAVNEIRVNILWCNARESAVGFYEKMGWRIVSERLNVPQVGPHFRMVTRLI